MFRNLLFQTVVAAIVMSVGACSSTTVSGSWRNADFTGTLRKVYIVGISGDETKRRIFEDEFGRQLQANGVTGISSYKDLAQPQKASKESIAERVAKNDADSVLITRMIGKRTEEVVTPGRVSSYGTGSRYGYFHPYAPGPYYRNWGKYYDRCCFEMTYEPATITHFQVAIIEANLYEAGNGELIWSAQLETIIEANLQKLITDFVTAVTEDLRREGLL